MILWAFSVITLLAVLTAAFVSDVRRATLALWLAGLSVGCIFLTLGVEVLAIMQWMISTLATISFVFFAVMFGEYGADHEKRSNRSILFIVLGLLAGAAFSAMIWFGGGEIPERLLTVPTEGNDIIALGKSLTENHLLSLEVLALTLLLALIGGGVISRPELEGSLKP
jgi:NADH:ubiquinone oxidoreductase subunit 6 (subunit J)